jgi:TRAP-type C4-dicarboxylate transport system substrate-binding protein
MEIPESINKLFKEEDRISLQKAIEKYGLPVTDKVEESLKKLEQILKEANIDYVKPADLYDAWNNEIKKQMRNYALRSAVAAILANSGGATGTFEEKKLVKKSIEKYLE